jgi:hypothetical protein
MPVKPSSKMNKPNGLLAQLLDAIHDCKKMEREAGRVIARGVHPADPAPYPLKVTQNPGSYLPLGWGE